MSARYPVPGPSYLREDELLLRERSTPPGPRVRLGMTAPSETDDGWWLAVLFAHDDQGLVSLAEAAPASGPPPGPPLMVLGPVFAGALAGFIAEQDGRQQLRLALPPAPDERRPWDRPLLLRLALRWEPMRAATRERVDLAREVMAAFRRTVEAAARPW